MRNGPARDRVVFRFDGPPAPEPPRLIGIQHNGDTINIGEWEEDGDYWLLRLPDAWSEPGPAGPGRIAIRLSRPPERTAPGFVEVERDGRSVCFGEAVMDGSDWLIVLPDAKPLVSAVTGGAGGG